MADTYTKFPEGIDTFEDNADLDSGHAAAAAQYTKYLADGKYTEASNYLNQNSGLRKYIIKAADINHVKHAITALEQHYAGAVNYIIDGKFDPDMMIHEYSYSYSGGTHTLTCKSGSSYSNAANGKAYFTTAFSDGHRLVINGKDMTSNAYCGTEKLGDGAIGAGQWVIFQYDTGRNIVNFTNGSGIGASKLAATTALPDQVLAGQTFYSKNKTLKTGTMQNYGTVTAELANGESYQIKAGYYSGGAISASGLDSNTPGTADEKSILEGKTAWVDGKLVKGSIKTYSATTQLQGGERESTKMTVQKKDGVTRLCVATDNQKTNDIYSGCYYDNVMWLWGTASTAAKALLEDDTTNAATANDVASDRKFIDKNGNCTQGTLTRRSYGFAHDMGFGTDSEYFALRNIDEGAYKSDGNFWAPEVRVNLAAFRKGIGCTEDKIANGESIADLTGKAGGRIATIDKDTTNGDHYSNVVTTGGCQHAWVVVSVSKTGTENRLNRVWVQASNDGSNWTDVWDSGSGLQAVYKQQALNTSTVYTQWRVKLNSDGDKCHAHIVLFV